METISARRKRKLEWLCERERDNGGYLAVAAQAGINAAYLDQVLKGVLLPAKKDGTRSPRALGDGMARAIEAAYELGVGWFDTAESEAIELSPEELDLVLAFRERRRERFTVHTPPAAGPPIHGQLSNNAAHNRRHGDKPKPVHKPAKKTKK